MIQKSLRFLFIISALFFCRKADAQEGCTDPQALNYNSAAVENDGSCAYRSTDYAPICLSKMPDELPECSGTEYFDGKLFALNDGGNDASLFQIDTATGEILRSIFVADADKKDWEDLAQNKDYLFIGDFGNNGGARRDLKILKIKKSDLSEDTVFAEEIYFNFSDQMDFTPRSNDNDYDCEAFFYQNDSLYIFTKNWVDNKTRMYSVPVIPGNYTLDVRAEFDVGGLVTSADISPDGEIITLLCYSENAAAFIWLLFDYKDFRPFSGNKRKIGIGSVLSVSQVEAITFQNNNEGFIGSENFSIFPGKLMHFSIQPWVENPPVNANQTVFKPELHFYPNPFVNELLIDLKTSSGKVKKIELFDRMGKRIMKKRNGLKKRIRINGNKLPAGMYVMKVTLKGGNTIIHRVIKN